MLRLALSTLRTRISSAVGALVAVTLTVVFMTSSGILLESSLRAGIDVDRLAAAGVVVQQAPEVNFGGEADNELLMPEQARLRADLAEVIATVDGVRAAIPDRTVPVTVAGVDASGSAATTASADAHGWNSAQLTPFKIIDGQAPVGPDQVVLDQATAARHESAVGDQIEVTGPESTQLYTVSGIASSARTVDPTIFTSDVTARALAGTGDRVELIGVLLDPAADPQTVAAEIEEVSDDPTVEALTGDDRGAAESHDDAVNREDTMAGLSMFGVLASFVAVFVLASAFALSVQQRHRELALLRAIGTTRRQVRRLVGLEALSLAAVATAIGAPIGVAVSGLQQRVFVSAELLSDGVPRTVSPLPIVVAFLLAVVTTQLAAFASSRRAGRIHPTEALRESAVPTRTLSRGRLVAGLVLVLAGVVALGRSARDGGTGGADAAVIVTMLWVLASVLLGPAIARPFTWLLSWPMQRLGRATGLLATSNTRTNPRRVASIATPLMLTVALGSTVVLSKATAHQELTQQSEERVIAQAVVSADEQGLPRDLARELAQSDDVLAVSAMESTSIAGANGGGQGIMEAQAVDPDSFEKVLDVGVTEGSIDQLRGRSIAVREGAWPHLGDVGEQVEIRLGDTTRVTVEIIASYDRGLGFADVILPRELVRGHTTSGFDDTVYVALEPGVEVDSLRALVARAQPDAVVDTKEQYVDRLSAAATDEAMQVFIVLGVILLFSSLAIVNALSMAIGQRVREFELLRLVGASRRQIVAMIRLETLVILGFGLILGLVVSVPALTIPSLVFTGRPLPVIPGWFAIGGLGGIAVVWLLTSTIPTWTALRKGSDATSRGQGS
jgi:putative ABC transport system permease protein